MYLASVKINKITNKDYIRLVPEHSISEMIKILSSSNASEGYITDPKGKLLGKVSLPELLQINQKKNIEISKFKKYLFLNKTDSILKAIDKIKDFVGESIPVIDESGNILGIISESDLFNELLKAEKERNDEELS